MSAISDTSTIFIKAPRNYRESITNLKEKCQDLSPFVTKFVWGISSLYSASSSSFSPNIKGLQLSFCVSDLLMWTVATVMLLPGIHLKKIQLQVPWLILSTCSLYFSHYLGLMNTLSSLKTYRNVSWLPWVTVTGSAVLLAVRMTLVLRVFQLCTRIWLKQKLREMKYRLTKTD